jgi:hypothetical protein
MTYYVRRRMELLGSRKRKPRRCDVARRAAARRSERVRAGRTKAALNALERAWNALL